MITADDLFTEEYDESNDLERIEEPEEHDENNEEEAEEESTTRTVVKPKRIVRNPQPKLNAETLKGKRGLTALESYFERVKFKGKGHEEQDLNVLLKTYEYWCHRLFPKYPFDDCIAKIEALGTKKAVQTHIKRIRLDMIVDDDAPIAQEDQNGSDNEELEPSPATDVFTPVLQVSSSESSQLTEEQLEQIRLNKQKAEKIRQERLAKIRNSAQTSLGESSRLPASQNSHSIPENEAIPVPGSSQQDLEFQESPPDEEIENLLDRIEEIQNSSSEHLDKSDQAIRSSAL